MRRRGNGGGHGGGLLRGSAGALVGVLVAVGAVLLVPTPAAACSLMGQPLTISPATVEQGGSVTVSGDGVYWFDGELGADCSGLETYEGPATVVLLAEGRPPLELGGVSVGPGGMFGPVPLTVPLDTPPDTWRPGLVIPTGSRDQLHPGRYGLELTVLAPQLPTTTVEATTTSTGAPTTAAPNPTTTVAAHPVAVTPSFTG